MKTYLIINTIMLIWCPKYWLYKLNITLRFCILPCQFGRRRELKLSHQRGLWDLPVAPLSVPLSPPLKPLIPQLQSAQVIQSHLSLCDSIADRHLHPLISPRFAHPIGGRHLPEP